ncbi:MAG: YCF48-related protein [Ignavibacteriaceae bacterium]
MKNIIFLIFFISTKILAQWIPIHPYPFVDRCFAFDGDDESCRVISQRGNLIMSTDAGNSWNYNFTSFNPDIGKIFFVNENYGWASNGTQLLKTEDGGYNWQEKGFVLTSSYPDFFFNDTLNGWAVGGSYVKSTIDGGETWNIDTLQGNPMLRFISQYNDSIFFTGGMKLFRSIDYGETWNQHSDPLNFTQYRTFLSINNIGFIVGNYYNIAKTTDAGETWSLVFPNTGYYQVHAMKYNNGLIITCGSDRVLKSTDFGNSWDSVAVPMANYHTIYFATDSVIYISGEKGVLIKSTDRGNSFIAVSTNFINDPIFATSFSDSLNGYIITNLNPKVYRTMDGGKIFSDITPLGMYESAHNVYAVTNEMVIVTSDNRIYVTKDGGFNWIYSSYGPGNTYVPNDIYFKDTLNGMVVCGWNLIRETTDGGNSWTNKLMGTTQEHIQSVSFPDTLNGYYSTGDKLYKTTNGGLDWQFLRNLDMMFSKIRFVNSNEGVGGGYGGIFYTNDGGMNWTRSDEIGYVNSFDIRKHGNNSVLMALKFDSLYTSYNLGLTWERKFIPFANLTNIQMHEPSTAWLSGDKGSIAKYYIESLPSSVESQFFINKFTLLQNYPNPFNPRTKISWQSPVGSWQTLKVYDVLGREVVTLVDEYRDAGYHEVEFQSAAGNGQLASGIYFYQLKADKFVETRKMIYLR